MRQFFWLVAFFIFHVILSLITFRNLTSKLGLTCIILLLCIGQQNAEPTPDALPVMLVVFLSWLLAQRSSDISRVAASGIVNKCSRGLNSHYATRDRIAGCYSVTRIMNMHKRTTKTKQRNSNNKGERSTNHQNNRHGDWEIASTGAPAGGNR